LPQSHLRKHLNNSTAQHSTGQGRAGQGRAGQGNTGQHSTAHDSTAQHSTAQHSTAQHSTAQRMTTQHSAAHSTMKQTAPGCSIRADHGAEDLLASPQLNRLQNGGHRQIIALSCVPHVCAQESKLTPAVEAVLGSHQKGRCQKVLHSTVSWSNSTYRHKTDQHQNVGASAILWCLLIMLMQAVIDDGAAEGLLWQVAQCSWVCASCT